MKKILLFIGLTLTFAADAKQARKVMKRLRRKLFNNRYKRIREIVLVLTILQEMEVGVVNVVLTIESVVLRHCVIQKT
jgi:putative copper export protein